MDKIRWLILFIGFLVFLCCSSLTICSPAAAVLRKHHESPGVLRYHAQSSLKDKQGYTWQVVLFPERSIQAEEVWAELDSTPYKPRPKSNLGDSLSPVFDNRVTKYHLRLVGFPGIAEFIHPQSLEIITAKGRVLNATDLITVSSPAPNVGEFDLTNVLPILPEKGSLKLSTILRGDRDLSLSIPESTLIEWQWLALTD